MRHEIVLSYDAVCIMVQWELRRLPSRPPATRPVGTQAPQQRRVPPSLSRVYPALLSSPAALAQGDLVNPRHPRCA